MLCFVPATSEWPRWLPILLGGLAGAGYAAADVIPWSMLADVVDADELRTRERREGLYSGFFFFLRKLGGAVAVFVAGVALDLAGFVRGRGAAQPDSALQAIRVLTGFAPALFIGLSVLLARAYPISRDRHAKIRDELDARRADVEGTLF
jgi:Na+/melibiose symporter-like transporter